MTLEEIQSLVDGDGVLSAQAEEQVKATVLAQVPEKNYVVLETDDGAIIPVSEDGLLSHWTLA